MKYLFSIFGLFFLGVISNFGQESTVDSFDKENLNWYNKDLKRDKIPGASVEKAYATLLLNRQIKDTIIVAVIDGGVDIRHDEIAGKIWENKKEVPGNRIDDDNNGYVDDINGWNFIGSKSGENIQYENYEYTRILKLSSDTVATKKAKELYEKELKEHKSDSTSIETFELVYQKAKSIIREKTGIEVKSAKDLKKVRSGDKYVTSAKKFLKYRYSIGFSDKILDELKERSVKMTNYYLNMNFNPRTIIGDNPHDMNEKYYGNNDVTGPNPDHGTAVAGVIASLRNNQKGIDGIASAVKIIPLRVVPEGDERDKDIALAIIYAVDHGARVINMSFGKRLSPQKEFVDFAVKYAEKHNVLLVHASGNYGENIDTNETYPSDRFIDGTEASNLICVGASTMKRDKQMAADFSNYGQKHVDLFAPGKDIIALDSGNTYDKVDGTSFSAPVVSGIAAVILSYYPDISATELIEILKDGSVKFDRPVTKPGLSDTKKTLVPFNELSKSGGIVNLYSSLLIAAEREKSR